MGRKLQSKGSGGGVDMDGSLEEAYSRLRTKGSNDFIGQSF